MKPTDGRGVDRHSPAERPDRRGHQEWRQVADGMAPALVELVGLDDDVGQRRRRRSAADTVMTAVRAPARPCRVERRVRGGRPALVRDADDEAARRRVEGQLERLGRHGTRDRPAPAARIASRRISATAERAVLGRAAAGHDDRLAGRDGLTDRVGQPPAPLARSARRVSRPLRQRRLGRDHVGHVVRRPARRLGVGSHPTGRAGPGAGRSGRSREVRLMRVSRIGSRHVERRPVRRRSAAASTRHGTEPTDGPVETSMQVGLMAPQGWKGEYDGWDPAAAWARTVELAREAERARLRVALGVRSLPHGAPARSTR